MTIGHFVIIIKKLFEKRSYRGVAQLVARHVRDVEAASSNLVTPMVGILRNVEKSMFLGISFCLCEWIQLDTNLVTYAYSLSIAFCLSAS